jgi:hypothetical protein
MNARIALKDSAHFRAESLRIGGQKLQRERQIDVVNPFTRERVGTVPMYEVGRVADVLLFGASEALRDDGQSFSCDLTPHGKSRRVHTMREPLLGVISAITPFNHPMNQVAHKVVPRWPPTTAWCSSRPRRCRCRRWPGRPAVRSRPAAEMLQRDHRRPARDRRRDAHQPARGPRHLHRRRAHRQVHRRPRPATAAGAGARRQRPDHRDGRRRPGRGLDLAVQGSYKNSGQRCTAVKRMLVHEKVAQRFTDLVVAKTRAWSTATRWTRRSTWAP